MTEQQPGTGSAQPSPAPARPASAPSAKDGNVPWGLVALGALVVYVVLFVLFNDDRVNVSFVFFSAETSLVVALALAVAIGFLLGFFTDVVRTRRRRRRDKPGAS